MFALSQAATDTIVIIAVWGVAFPLLVQGLLMFIAAQVAVERKENLEYERAHPRL